MYINIDIYCKRFQFALDLNIGKLYILIEIEINNKCLINDNIKEKVYSFNQNKKFSDNTLFYLLTYMY